MKKPPRKPQPSLDVDRFIRGAATAEADRTPPKRTPRTRTPPAKRPSRAKFAAEGFTRTSFDLPDDLHERLKIAAVKEKRPMRELVVEAIRAGLDGSGY